MRSIGPAVTREQSPAFLRNSNGRLDFPGKSKTYKFTKTRKKRTQAKNRRKSSNHKKKNKKGKEQKKKHRINQKTRLKMAINTYLSIITPNFNGTCAPHLKTQSGR